jgi:hypothetical protein
VRQIVQLGVDTGNGALDYLAYRVLGTTDAWKQQGNGRAGADDDPDEEPRSPRTAVLAGRARAHAQRQAPKTIELKKGMAGYRQAGEIAAEFLRGRGHS